MFTLITISNAGGVSGAGSNIPIMLIFFNLSMKESVPLSAFVGCVATLFRFALNYSQKHPHRPERNTINYEVIEITMPAVFLGTFIGVILNQICPEMIKVTVFGVTVAWSLQTTHMKYLQLKEKERKIAAGEFTGGTSAKLLEEHDMEKNTIEADTPDMRKIKVEESQHFTAERVVFIVLCFSILFGTQIIYKQPDLDATKQRLVFGLFTFAMLGITYNRVHKIKKIHEVKARDNYNFDDHDTRFDSFQDVLTLSAFCMIAAILCGLTGIAGGMVLGPLFLKYNMLPSVMSGTNQYITMVASISVASQFIYINFMNYYFAALFGVIALVSAFTGITVVNKIVAKSGKQSIIAGLLVIVLLSALISLPLNYLLR